jgi:RNA polymerase sigma-70 factor (ECF subfamily)
MLRLVYFAATGAGLTEGGGVPTADLIQRFQDGQPRAFEALYNRYKDYVYRVAFYTTRHADEAEDATQEAFLDVLKALPHYDVGGPARFETWLYRVTVNRCRMRMRRKRPHAPEWGEIEERLARMPDPNIAKPEAVTLQHERAGALWQAVDRLPEPHRLVVLLRYQQDFSYQEIAETLSISLGTVKSRLYNAHKKLKGLLVV